MIGSYGKIWNLGHPAVADLFDGPVQVEEKVDGSQFAWCRLDDRVIYRSKGAEVFPESPGMFRAGVESIEAIAHRLTPGWIYRGEYLAKPKHNVLAYDRVPRSHVILFDIETAPSCFVSAERKKTEAEAIGLEVVPTYTLGSFTRECFDTCLTFNSVLGGQKIEGLVFKNYSRFGRDGKVLMGKYVSEAFKEIHRGEWKAQNPTKAEFVETLVQSYRTPARWNKAIQHLAEAGKLENSPKDIGALIREAQNDLVAEELESLKAQLWAHFGPKILRGVIAGLPEFYKNRLVEKQFEEKKETENGAA